MRIIRNIPAIAAGLLIFSSCLSSVKLEEGQTEISFYPVTDMGARSETGNLQRFDLDLH